MRARVLFTMLVVVVVVVVVVVAVVVMGILFLSSYAPEFVAKINAFNECQLILSVYFQ